MYVDLQFTFKITIIGAYSYKWNFADIKTLVIKSVKQKIMFCDESHFYLMGSGLSKMVDTEK